MKNKKRIEYLESCIKNMRRDGEIFGLVREDLNKIMEWTSEISILRQEGKIKK